MGKLALGLVATLLAALLYFQLRQQAAEPPVTDRATAPPPVALSLTWLRAMPEERSAVVVRILDRAARTRPPGYQPAVLRFSPEDWLRRIRFHAVDTQGNRRELNAALQWVASSPETATPLTESSRLQAVLLLPGQPAEPGIQWLQASMDWQGQSVASNRAYPAAIPADQAARWRRRVQIALLTKDAALLEQAADAMQGTPLAWHYYRGLALELRGQTAQARQAYRQALKLWQQNPGDEPPGQLLQRMRKLQGNMPAP